jgi:poly-gamma-glutamate synthesis protein (capsule biosynthesis protein)
MTRLFLSGDVMTGRGIDQVLPRSCDPQLHEPWVADARQYVELAEQQNGPIPSPVDYAYVWGAALDEINARSPDARIVNLETSITTSGDHWPEKSIHYRMHPANTRCLSDAQIDCCVLANNHVLDWGYAGLDETLNALDAAGIRYAGAGPNETAATAPAVIDRGTGGRVLVFALGDASSGIPGNWRARVDKAGVNLIDDTSRQSARYIAACISEQREPGDVTVVSIHWGGNWGYGVSTEHRDFAHELIDSGVVDVVHGHSSHHAKGIEVREGKLILYGCGDLINDYEGISGHEGYRSDLSLLYFVDIDPARDEALSVEIVPLRRERFRLSHVSKDDARWLAEVLNREGATGGTRAILNDDKSITLQW